MIRLLLNRWFIGAVAIAFLSVFGGYLVHNIKQSGYEKCKAEYAKAQADYNKKVKKHHDKIDKETPVNPDQRTAIEWLRKYTVGE